jgi:AraC family transcriptional regulator
MKTDLGEMRAVSESGATLSREWMHLVIRLLNAAAGQLHDPAHPAQLPLLEAASLLRHQINPQAAGQTRELRGRLLAWQARKVRDYIDCHIAEPVRAADLCELIDRSEAYFSRCFRSTFGESPHAFVIRRRVELAAQTMLQTDAALSDIAARFGFVDQAHLGRRFRQVIGQTPAAWRRARSKQHESRAAVPSLSGRIAEQFTAAAEPLSLEW